MFFIWHWHYKHYKVFFCYDDMRIPTLRGQRNLPWKSKMLLLLHHVSPKQLLLHEQDHAVHSVTGRLGSDELPHTVVDRGPRRLPTSSGCSPTMLANHRRLLVTVLARHFVVRRHRPLLLFGSTAVGIQNFPAALHAIHYGN